MIKLINIKRNDGVISCDAKVEDCKKIIPLSLDESNGHIKSGDLPEGYEYCTQHLRFAERFLKSLIGLKSIPSEKLIMWY